MCSIGAIRLSGYIWTVLRGIFAAFLFFAGVSLCSSVNISRAFGNQFIGYGIGLIFISLMSASLMYPHMFANKRHNRFLLLVIFSIDTIIFSVALWTGVTIGSFAVNLFPKSLQTACLLNAPTIPIAECADYFNSDRLAALRVFWEGLFYEQSEPSQYQIISNVQSTVCCGFFAPLNCHRNNASFPSFAILTGLPASVTSHRVMCGPVGGYYVETPYCKDYYVDVLKDKILGGCQYDYALGFCLKDDVSPISSGCASRVEDYANSMILPFSSLLPVAAIFNLLMMLYSCCLFWKRKEDDVFPANIAGYKLDVEFHKIKHQFEVVPHHNILTEQGYIVSPEEAHAQRVAETAARQQQEEKEMPLEIGPSFED